MVKQDLLQEEILCKALIEAKKAFTKCISKYRMNELFDVDVTGYCYDDRGNMTFKVAMEGQDGIDPDEDFDTDESGDDNDEQ